MSSVRSARNIDSALMKKGFLRFQDSDHVRYRFFGPDNANPVARTKMSHGVMGDTIGPKLIGEMARQLHLTKKQFLDLIDCPISEEDYRAILREQA